MSVRFLSICLIPAALLTAALGTHVLAPRVSLRADEGGACLPCQTCPCPGCAAQPACCEKMETRTYQVADLVLPLGNTWNAKPQAAPTPCLLPASPPCTTAVLPCPGVGQATTKDAGCCPNACPPRPRAANELCTPPTMENELIKLIVHTIAPDSWQEKGGKGTIDYFPATMTLVVNQTLGLQEEIADLLAALRRLQDVQVTFEVRFVSLPEACYDRLKKDFDLAGKDPETAGAPQHVSFFDDKQLFALLERAQADQNTSVVQTPRLTVFNGQRSAIDITEKKPFVTGVKTQRKDGQSVVCPEIEVLSVGTHVGVQPIVSPDRRFVRLSLDVSLSSLSRDEADLFPVVIPVLPRDGKGNALEPVVFTQFIQQPCLNMQNLSATVPIPTGHTAVFSGWKRTKECRHDDTPPAVKELAIPFLNKLFKSTKYVRETECVLMLVTPRVIVPAEEEPDAFDDVNGLCWPFDDEPLPRPATGCDKDKNNPDGSVRPTVKVLDPESPGGFRDILITVTEQNTGGFQVGADFTSGAGFTGSVCNERNFNCEVAQLLEKYHQACAAGRRAEATELAVKALALDPACFHKASCPSEK
jgi:hypothetical protein